MFKKPINKKINGIVEPNSVQLTSQNIKTILSENSDFTFRKISINTSNREIPIGLIYIDGLVNSAQISDYVIKPLIQESRIQQITKVSDIIQLIEDGNLYFSAQSKTTDIDCVLHQILTGATALIFDEYQTAFLFDTKGFEKRAITEPSTENITKGSKDCFVETLRINTATVRRKIKSVNLIIEQIVIGKLTRTPVAIVYLKNSTNSRLLAEVKKRLTAIHTDNVLSTNLIEEFISDNINSVFPQLSSTERPDKFCSDLVEGRVGIIIDGIPVSFIIPGTLVQFMQAEDDYSRNYIIASITRFMRYGMLLISLLLPAIFIAITTFHTEMLPSNLVLTIAKSREGVAFPVFMETILMLFAFEILFEASLRVPKTIGQAVSIVGTLIVGQAAVDAKIVSPAVIIVIALAGIASFSIPNQDLSSALRLWRLILAFLSSMIGLFGLFVGVIILVHHLCKLETFGVPYLSPFVSSDGEDQLEDTLFRFPFKNN